MFEVISNLFKKLMKSENQDENSSKDTAKERLQLVLMQDRANVSVEFLELMKQEIIDVIKKYIVVDERAIDVRLTNQTNSDGTTGAPSLYANIPILNIKNDVKGEKIREAEEKKKENNETEIKENVSSQIEEVKQEEKEENNEVNNQEEENIKEDNDLVENTATETKDNNSEEENK